MAITAWSAKVCRNLDLAGRKLTCLLAGQDQRALHPILSEQRHAEKGARRVAVRGEGHGVGWVGRDVGNMLDRLRKNGPPGDRMPVRLDDRVGCEIALQIRTGIGAGHALIPKNVAVPNA